MLILMLILLILMLILKCLFSELPLFYILLKYSVVSVIYKVLKITSIPECDLICLPYLRTKFKVGTLLTFEVSQSESTKFNYDQSELTAHI